MPVVFLPPRSQSSAFYFLDRSLSKNNPDGFVSCIRIIIAQTRQNVQSVMKFFDIQLHFLNKTTGSVFSIKISTRLFSFWKPIKKLAHLFSFIRTLKEEHAKKYSLPWLFPIFKLFPKTTGCIFFTKVSIDTVHLI